MKKHLTKCVLAGLVAILPIGGLIVLVVTLDQSLRPLIKNTPLDFPGVALLAAMLCIYLVGLMVSTFIGRWLWRRVDRLLGRLPGLATIYQTLKQVLGYGEGKEAVFREVVLVRGEGGALEIGLVTDQVTLDGQSPRWTVFVPGSPNPAQGRMLLLEPSQCVVTKIAVSVAFKALLSTGKTGLATAE